MQTVTTVATTDLCPTTSPYAQHSALRFADLCTRIVHRKLPTVKSSSSSSRHHHCHLHLHHIMIVSLIFENTSLWRLKRLATLSTYRRYIHKCIYLSISIVHFSRPQNDPLCAESDVNPYELNS